MNIFKAYVVYYQPIISLLVLGEFNGTNILVQIEIEYNRTLQYIIQQNQRKKTQYNKYN